jgi:PAS domain S-box-containing protein
MIDATRLPRTEDDAMLKGLSRETSHAILEAIPMELTVLDENDRIVGWNRDGARIFDRPDRVIGQDVRTCHSEKSLGMIERMLREMKTGERRSARFWYEEEVDGGARRRKLLIEYYALRDERGRYIGCVEALQDLAELMSLTGEKRTLD